MDYEKMCDLIKQEYNDLLENTRIHRMMLLDSVQAIDEYVNACERGDNIDKSNAYMMLQIQSSRIKSYIGGRSQNEMG